MYEECFLLLMQLTYGDHDQRQQANFRLSRKGVPDKLRLKAKHKGWAARQSLKEALRESIAKEEFRLHTQQHVAQPLTRA